MDANTTPTVNESTSPVGPMAEFGAALDSANERRAESTADTSDSDKSSDGKTPDDVNRDQNTRTTDDAERARRAQNNLNAQRRIRNRREQQNTRNRLQELERQAQEKEAAGDPNSMLEAREIRNRIGDMQATVADSEYNDFYDRAVEEMGDDADAFVQQTLRYSKYVNAAEPDLLQYAQRPMGLQLLNEWYKRMDVPELREQWLQMTPTEKGLVLKKFYSQITQRQQPDNTIQFPGGTSEPPKEQPKTNAPVPGSGRETTGQVPDDDFGLLLQQARNRRINSRR